MPPKTPAERTRAHRERRSAEENRKTWRESARRRREKIKPSKQMQIDRLKARYIQIVYETLHSIKVRNALFWHGSTCCY